MTAAGDDTALTLFDDENGQEQAPAPSRQSTGRRRPRHEPDRAAGRHVHIEVGRRSAWLHGRGLHAAVNKLHIPSMWCPYYRCLSIPAAHVDDLLAYLESGRRRYVTVEAVDR